MRTAAGFLGYWDNPEATAAALDHERWYRTGDFGHVTDGFVYLEGPPPRPDHPRRREHLPGRDREPAPRAPGHRRGRGHRRARTRRSGSRSRRSSSATPGAEVDADGLRRVRRREPGRVQGPRARRSSSTRCRTTRPARSSSTCSSTPKRRATSSPSDEPGPIVSVLDDLAAALPADVVVTDPDIIEPYRFDRAETVVPGPPIAVVRARCTADVQATVRVAAAHRVPIVPRGAGTGLSGGSAAIDGCITLSTERMRDIEIDPVAMVAVVEPGLLNAEVKTAARAHGLWYPPGPVELRDLLDRRQHGDQRRRPVLREVRRHDRLRARARGRAGRRHGRAPRRAHDQRRRRLRPETPVRRQRGNARHHHLGHAAAATAASARVDGGRRRSPTWSTPAVPSPR